MIGQHHDAIPRRRGAHSAHRTTSAPQAAPIPDPAIAAHRERAIDAALRCVRSILTQLNRDYERCGKSACLRAKRCRGLACEPDALA